MTAGRGRGCYNKGMSTITIQDVQNDPIACLDRVAAGETLLVMRESRPVAEIKPVVVLAAEPRPFGLCAGEFTVPADFDEPLPESVLRDFEGL